MAILTLNAGSSSLKLAIYNASDETLLMSGAVDRIGGEGSLHLRHADGRDFPLPPLERAHFADHRAALETVLRAVRETMPGLDISAVGHRVVHGGPDYAAPLLLDAQSLERLKAFEPLAPLHQPHNLAGIRAAMAAFPQAQQIACFDTAFHRSHPRVNDIFALPRRFFEAGIRRYGFHGLSYEYIVSELKRRAPLLSEGKVVVCHLGNGASVCAIQDGKSIASTMGFSALDGLPMGTRCGQLDPGVLLYLMDHEGMSPAELSDLLYKQSGLLGLSGISNDMRTLEASKAPEAEEAIDYFVFRVQREIGAMAAALGGIDALVFCGGIGENSTQVRARICERLHWMGVEIDPHRNASHQAAINSEFARVSVLVIPTNEELVIARAAQRFLAGLDAR